jgi:hypothetical protein
MIQADLSVNTHIPADSKSHTPYVDRLELRKGVADVLKSASVRVVGATAGITHRIVGCHPALIEVFGAAANTRCFLAVDGSAYTDDGNSSAAIDGADVVVTIPATDVANTAPGVVRWSWI